MRVILHIMSIEPVKWQAPPKELFLKAGEVHVWLVHSPAQNFLDAKEEARAAKFVSPVHQQQFRDIHNGLREILSRYVHQSPQEIIFSKTASGKPILKNFPDIHFNLSHSEDVGLCAISNNPVGIDVECLEKDIDYLSIAKRFFGSTEEINNKLDFFKVWTRKECYLKSEGKGIALNLDKNIPKDFSIQHFIPVPRYLGAVGGRVSFCRTLYFVVAPKSHEPQE